MSVATNINTKEQDEDFIIGQWFLRNLWIKYKLNQENKWLTNHSEHKNETQTVSYQYF
jgi:hypothetical protein